MNACSVVCQMQLSITVTELSNATRETALYHGHTEAADAITAEDILRVILPRAIDRSIYGCDLVRTAIAALRHPCNGRGRDKVNMTRYRKNTTLSCDRPRCDDGTLLCSIYRLICCHVPGRFCLAMWQDSLTCTMGTCKIRPPVSPELP
jgi:hypothetical protein